MVALTGSIFCQRHVHTTHSVYGTSYIVLHVPGGLKVSVKKTRAPADLEENLDDRNVQVPEPSTVPPGFLSPSVKEYLELGKSIPGKVTSTPYVRIRLRKFAHK